MRHNPTHTVPLKEAARRLGVGRWLAYRLAPTGWLVPGRVPVLQVGRKFVVPVAPLAEALGVPAQELVSDDRGDA